MRTSRTYRRLQSKLRRQSVRRRFIRIGLLTTNVAVLAVITVFLLQNQHATTVTKSDSSSTRFPSGIANPLDQLSSANIALTVARMASLPETTAINNQADSEETQLTLAPTTDDIVAKPQVVATAFKSRADIQTYVAKSGDSVASVAAKFGVTSNSILWSNSLTSTTTTVAVGTKLTIPPVNGIVYTVKAGDTPASLASKYNTNSDQITAYNDAEINGLYTGERIIIPNGTIAATPVYTAAAVTGGDESEGFAFGGAPTYGGNGYDFGYCTWYVAQRRIELGKPIPTNLGDAWSWKYRAAAAGLSVSETPVAGAVVYFNFAYPGHVGIVDSVNADGSITMSEMNAVGWDRVDSKTIPASQIGDYAYIN